MSVKFKVVVFDLDGTIADTLVDIAEATNSALIKNGYQPYPIESYPKMVGDGMYKLVERAAKGADRLTIKKIANDFLLFYDRDCLKNSKPYKGMPEVLEELRKAGVRMFVVTNKPDKQAQKIVEHLYGNGLFEGVYGNKEGRKVKPDPTLTLEVLSKAKVHPSESLFIGDSNVDIFTAANAGMMSAGVGWGFRGVDELKSAGADYIFKNPEDIIDTLLI